MGTTFDEIAGAFEYIWEPRKLADICTPGGWSTGYGINRYSTCVCPNSSLRMAFGLEFSNSRRISQAEVLENVGHGYAFFYISYITFVACSAWGGLWFYCGQYATQ